MTYENIPTEVNANAAVAADAVNAQFQPASTTAPAGFAVTGSIATAQQTTGVHELQIALTPAKLVSFTDELIQRRKDWEAGALKASDVAPNFYPA